MVRIMASTNYCPEFIPKKKEKEKKQKSYFPALICDASHNKNNHSQDAILLCIAWWGEYNSKGTKGRSSSQYTKNLA